MCLVGKGMTYLSASQDLTVQRAHANISTMLDSLPTDVELVGEGGQVQKVAIETVKVGDIVRCARAWRTREGQICGKLCIGESVVSMRILRESDLLLKKIVSAHT